MNKTLQKIVAGFASGIFLFVISASPSAADAQLSTYKTDLGDTCYIDRLSYNSLSGY